MRLSAGASDSFESESHFLGVAARAMRFVLIDYAREQSASKRGGRLQPTTTLPSHLTSARTRDIETLLALEDALARLAELNPRLVQVVECRYFAGLTAEETAAALGVSVRTVQRDWRLARAQLRSELEPEAG